MLEMRNGFFDEAEKKVLQSLEIHSAKGRLWATLIQLLHAKASSKGDFDEVYKTFI